MNSGIRIRRSHTQPERPPGCETPHLHVPSQPWKQGRHRKAAMQDWRLRHAWRTYVFKLSGVRDYWTRSRAAAYAQGLRPKLNKITNVADNGDGASHKICILPARIGALRTCRCCFACTIHSGCPSRCCAACGKIVNRRWRSRSRTSGLLRTQNAPQHPLDLRRAELIVAVFTATFLTSPRIRGACCWISR